MSAPYLEEMEDAFRHGVRNLREIAEYLGIEYESACLSFDNGVDKGYWSIVLPRVAEMDKNYSGGKK